MIGEPGQPLERALLQALELLAQKERELAEARRSEERYRSLVEKVMDFVFCVDRAGRFTFANSAVLSMLGYRPEELTGQHFATILAEESMPMAMAHFERNLQGPGPREVYELEMVAKDGRRVPIEIHGTNVYGEEGEVAGVRGIARDISGRRRAEEQQRHRFNELRAISQVGQQIASVLELDELLPSIVELVREEVGYHNVNVFLRDDAGSSVVLKATSCSYGPPLPLGTCLKIGEQGIVGWVAKTGEPMLVNDVSREPRYHSPKELLLTRSELTVPIRLGGQIVGVLDIESERQDDFDEADLWAAQTLAGQIAAALRNAELFEAEKTRREETSLILEVTRSVNSTLLVDEVLRVAANSMARGVGVASCGIYLMDETGTRLLPRMGSDTALSQLVRGPFMSTPLEIPSDRFLSEVMETRQPTICANAETDPRTDKEIVKKLFLKSMLAVPFVARDRVLGLAMVTSFLDFYDFSQEQVELAAGIANSVALAIDNARLYERTRELAVMEERNRLAREIHDTLAQGLTAIILQLEAADHLMDSNLERARMRVRKATDLARSSLQDARRSVWNLRPTPLEERRLDEALRQEAARLEEESGIRAAVEVEGESCSGISGEAENGLFRIAQEALNNIRKHARASRVGVRLADRGNLLELQVRDDGVGFDPTAVGPTAAGGFGLLGLKERARMLGGSLRVESASGRGTLIEVQIPIRR